jgi:hypothetical protein
MNKDVSIWTAVFAFIALGSFVWGLMCNQARKDALNEINKYKDIVQEFVKKTDNEYLYVDINGVYHFSNTCSILKSRAEHCEVYSYSHVEFASVHDWKDFFESEQICAKCFQPKYVIKLRDKETLLKHIQSKEDLLECFRDIDEEYYN